MSQTLKITIIAVALTLLAVEFASFFLEGQISLRTTRLNSFREVVTVAGPSARSLRKGDVIDYRRMSVSARTAWLLEPQARETISVPVQRSGREVPGVVTFLPQLWDKPTLVGVFVPALIAKVALFILAVFALLRGRGRTALYFGLYCIAVSISADVQLWAAVPITLRGWAVVLGQMIFFAALLFGTLVIDSLCREVVSRWFRVVVWVLIGGTLLTLTLANLYDDVIGPLLLADASPSFLPRVALNIAVIDLAYLYCAVGFFKSRGLQRYRLGWFLWATTIGAIGVNLPLFWKIGENDFGLAGILENTTLAISVAGYAYAILRHNIIDVKFVVNKALLYTILTAIIVAVLSISESAIERSTLAHNESLALEVLVPLILGLAAFRLHAILEKALDLLFYRHRHIAEAELRELLRSATDMDDERQLVDAVVIKIQSAMGNGAVAPYEMHDGDLFCIKNAGGQKFPSRITYQDNVVSQIAMKATEVDLRRSVSVLRCSGYAFGMRVKGTIFGALVCCRDPEEPLLDFGERHLLQDIARELALELYVMRTSPAIIHE